MPLYMQFTLLFKVDTLKSSSPKVGQNTETPLSQETQLKKSATLSSSNTEIDLDKAIQDAWDEVIKKKRCLHDGCSRAT